MKVKREEENALKGFVRNTLDQAKRREIFGH